MVNNNLVNGQLVNGGNAPIDLDQDSLIFDGFSFVSACPNGLGVASLSGDHRNMARVDLETFERARKDGGGILGKKYAPKDIKFNIALLAVNNSELEDLIDEFKAKTSKTEGFLEWTVNGEIRIVKATAIRIEMGAVPKNTYFTDSVDITFRVLEPHFYLKANPNITFSGVTGDFQEELTNEGSALTSPIFYFIFKTGIVGLDNVGIEIQNQFKLEVNETINDSDVLKIDMENIIAELNGIEVDTDGVESEMSVGTNPVFFTFTPAATFDCDISVVWKQKFL